MDTLPVLKVKQIDGCEPGPKLLITGGVHGDEFEPMVAIRRLIKQIKPDQIRGTLVLVPVVNEPAYEAGWRWAEDGLDLARHCPGKADGSITERVAHVLSQLIRQADYYIDLHTGGTTHSVAPMAGYGVNPDPLILDVQRRMAKAFNLPIVWGTDPTLNGRSLSVARDAKVPAIYAEYLGTATCTPEGVEAYVDGCLNVMGELGMIDRTQPPTQVKYVVEDSRPNSGYMQLCYPAPCAGYFEPAVQLGQIVEIGDLIGTISDPLGDDVKEICSEQNGVVLMLKTKPYVPHGDSSVHSLDGGMAVIVDLDLPTGGAD